MLIRDLLLSVCGGRGACLCCGGIEGSLKIFNVRVKVVLLTNNGADEASPPERILILTSFSYVTIFSCVSYNIKYASRFFGVFSFVKINSHEICQPLHLQKELISFFCFLFIFIRFQGLMQILI